ncbi:MAG: hypothetical protein AB7O24_28705 [Kofleriaceae bacterium]
MTSPYRSAHNPEEIDCPRCRKRRLPPTDVASCELGCGTWVSAFASTIVLTEVDRRSQGVTKWWRVREACPLCKEQMTLRGEQPGLLQGCDLHGFWIDADTIAHTGLANGVDQQALDRLRNDPQRIEAEREARERAALERIANREIAIGLSYILELEARIEALERKLATRD